MPDQRDTGICHNIDSEIVFAAGQPPLIREIQVDFSDNLCQPFKIDPGPDTSFLGIFAYMFSPVFLKHKHQVTPGVDFRSRFFEPIKYEAAQNQP
jgi:hypothetical protein